MEKKTLQVPKTARYFQLGTYSPDTTELWIVCHGYGQLANYFLRNFSVLESPQRVIVAPEGLHRFYWEKFSGRVVASWMTKEDREDDIRDYCRYLDLLLRDQLQQTAGPVKIVVLGFSQGTATVCRWLANSEFAVDHLVLWAGTVPPDLGKEAAAKLFGKREVHCVYGSEDEFLKPDEVQQQLEHLEQLNATVVATEFNGNHRIDADCLLGLATRLQKIV